MNLFNAIITAVLTPVVLSTSISLAEPVKKEAREVDKDPDVTEEAESRKNASSRDREQREAEQGACGAD